jgi:5-carboxymethyl-2-hydroxymuconate isomerase
MPHFVIEYARQLEDRVAIDEVMRTIFEAGARSGVMNPADIKVRAIPYDHFRPEGGIDAFLHLTVSLLEGRSDRQKEDLATAVRAALAALLPDVGSISIDVRDMNPVAYKKRLLPGRGPPDGS